MGHFINPKVTGQPNKRNRGSHNAVSCLPHKSNSAFCVFRGSFFMQPKNDPRNTRTTRSVLRQADSSVLITTRAGGVPKDYEDGECCEANADGDLCAGGEIVPLDTFHLWVSDCS